MISAINLHAQAIALNCVMLLQSSAFNPHGRQHQHHQQENQQMCQFGLRMLNGALTALTQTRTCLAECRELIPYLSQPYVKEGDLVTATHDAISHMLAQASIASNEPFLLSKQIPYSQRATAELEKRDKYDAWFKEFRRLKRSVIENTPATGQTTEVFATISFNQISISAVRLARVFLALSTDVRLHKNSLAELTTDLTTKSPPTPVGVTKLAQVLDNLAQEIWSVEPTLTNTYRWLLQQNINFYLGSTDLQPHLP